MPVKILQIFNRYRIRGAEDTSVDRIAKQIVEAGYELERVEFSSEEWLASHQGFGRFKSLFYNTEVAQRLARVQTEYSADLWVAHNIWPAVSPSLYETAQRLKVPLLQFMHNWRPLSIGGTMMIKGQPVGMPARRHYLRECLSGSWQGSRVRTTAMAATMLLPRVLGWDRAVCGWIGISEFMRDRLVEAGWPREQTFALRHSFDLREKVEPVDKGFYLYLGRLLPQKGVRVLLEVWKQLHRELGAKTPLLILAGTGPLEAEIAAAATEIPFIRLAGQIDGIEKDDLLRHCRAVVAPALWWEPLGLTPYEAYEFEKPVLAARSGGLTETVIPEQTGLLHAPGDVAELLADVRALEADPARAAALGRQGRTWLEANASHEKWRAGFRTIVERTLTAPAFPSSC